MHSNIYVTVVNITHIDTTLYVKNITSEII